MLYAFHMPSAQLQGDKGLRHSDQHVRQYCLDLLASLAAQVGGCWRGCKRAGCGVRYGAAGGCCFVSVSFDVYQSVLRHTRCALLYRVRCSCTARRWSCKRTCRSCGGWWRRPPVRQVGFAAVPSWGCGWSCRVKPAASHTVLSGAPSVAQFALFYSHPCPAGGAESDDLAEEAPRLLQLFLADSRRAAHTSAASARTFLLCQVRRLVVAVAVGAAGLASLAGRA